MKRVMLISAVSALSLGLALALAAPVMAGDRPGVELKNVAARVVVRAEERSDVDLKVTYPANSKLPAIMVHMEGRTLVADGKVDKRHLQCREGTTVDVGGVGTLAVADLPVIYIKVPMNADVDAGGATFGEIGATSALDFSLGGCGHWTLGDVAGLTQINIGGDADITGGAVGALNVNIGGDGDVDLARVNGETSVNIGGDGNVTVKDGVMPALKVNIAGDGDIRFDGEAGDVTVRIMGDGNVHVKTVTGKITRMILGDGHITVGE